MRTFDYQGFDADGRPRRGLVEADTPKQARARLAEQGTLAERVVPVNPKGKRMGGARRATLYRELGALLEAGMPMDRALGLLLEADELRSVHAVLADVRDRVREGAALADALDAASNELSVFERAALESGERAGALVAVLHQLADVEEQRAAVTERLRSALIYPVFVAILGLAIAAGMLGFLVPRAQAVLIETQGELPGLTRAMMALGRWSLRGGAVLLVALILVIWLGRRRVRRDETLRARLEQLGHRVPFLGRSLGLLWSFRMARTLAMLVGSGVPLVDAITLAGRATGAAWVEQLARQSAAAVRQGQPVSVAFRAITPPLSPALAEWAHIGEGSGKLPEMLNHAADRCHARWETALSRSMALIEPLLIVLIGGFVLIVALSVLLPVLSMTNRIGG